MRTEVDDESGRVAGHGEERVLEHLQIGRFRRSHGRVAAAGAARRRHRRWVLTQWQARRRQRDGTGQSIHHSAGGAWQRTAIVRQTGSYW